MRIEELTQRHWSGRAAGACAMDDGFHAAPWTALDIGAMTPAWEALARRAGGPNPFFEPWFLAPSLRRFDPGGAVHLAMLWRDGRMAALMPIWLDRAYHGRRMLHLSAWIHPNSFCGAPLVEPGFEEEFWRACLPWADRTTDRALFLQMPQMPAGSAATRALMAVCAGEDRSGRIVHREQRAMLESGLDSEAYLAGALSTKKRKELRRQRKRLDELGEVSFVRLRDDVGLEDWVDRFLALELRGWKGTEGSALACDPRTAALLRESLTGAAEAGLLERLELALDGEPVAMLINFLAAPGSFAFKTAFDEAFARFSPGVLLQLENLALLEDPAIAWCDSCAAADHPMIERIWRGKREIVWINVAIGGTIRRRIGAALSAFEARRMEKRA